MKKQNISDAVIRRLPRYYRHLDELCQKGIIRISSNSLGQRMGITASQIRQDFSCFGEFGQQGYGYNVEELRSEIGHILSVDNKNTAIVIGVGHLGHALLENFPFSHCGISVGSAFDVDPAVIGSEIGGIPVRSTDDLDEYVKDNKPDIAVLTVPQHVAQGIADRLIDLGVRGIWNLTNTELDLGRSEVKCENVHLSDSVLTLSYRIANP